ncbi:Tetratricopeptide repeat [uncultured Caudovirales phage]|uniref:Tetratricopeptide repeat n=1 Tax=uncultured Caudovirales phage TaxID=2100421 RepID=A0A6J5LMD6_9CAUD|nr:Tetratricopeptide repeat [uncultured Caudovirales phage]
MPAPIIKVDHFGDYNKGTKYLNKNEFVKAIQFLKREANKNEFKECLLNLGNAYKAVGDWERARVCYEKAASRDIPSANGSFRDYDLAISNLGLWYYAHGDDVKAIELYRQALEMNPHLADAVWNYASAILRQWCSGIVTDLVSAWKMYEFRFWRGAPVPIDKSVELWDGFTRVPCIVVLAEQGMGDKIMWGRWIKQLSAYTDRIVVQTPKELEMIFSDWETTQAPANTIPGAVGIPICSLGQRFLEVPPGDWLRGKFRGTHEFDLWNLNVGIEWAGSITHANNRNRSITPERFVKLAKDTGVNLYSFRESGPRGINYLNSNTDWNKTIDYLLSLDLLITVDTSIAHMAGSLGVEVWLLQPSIETDFRWGNDSMGEKNIWYDSVKIIRNPNNWDKVFEVVRKKLEAKKEELVQLRVDQGRLELEGCDA